MINSLLQRYKIWNKLRDLQNKDIIAFILKMFSLLLLYLQEKLFQKMEVILTKFLKHNLQKIEIYLELYLDLKTSILKIISLSINPKNWNKTRTIWNLKLKICKVSMILILRLNKVTKFQLKILQKNKSLLYKYLKAKS